MYHLRTLLFCFFLAYALLLGACGAAKHQTPDQLSTQNKAMETCPGIYMFAPSRYSISLVTQDQIVIDPARRPFLVYCTPEQARKALEKAQADGKVPASMELRVYQLEGDWRDMVRKDGDKYFLNKAALLLETVE